MKTKKEEPRGISRYTYTNSDFQGYRLTISSRGDKFIKYFSDKKYKSKESAFKAAKKANTKIRGILANAKPFKKKNTKATVKQVSPRHGL